MTRSVQKVSSHTIWKIETFIEGDTTYKTLYIRQWCLSPLQSRHLGTSHSSPSRCQLPYFPESHRWSEISSLSKGILVLGTARSHRASNLGHRGWVTWVVWCFTKNSARDVMHEWACCPDEAANHQLPTAAAFWTMRIVSTEECLSLMQNWMQVHCSTQSFWMGRPHSTHTRSMTSTTPTDQYSEVVIVHTCAFQPMRLGCQVTLMSRKSFSLY